MSEPPSQPRSVRFGSFEVSFPSREVRKHGVRVRLPGQPFDILAILLERAGDVVTREELRQRLWPADTFVDFEHGMNSAVKRLRAALGDSADHPLYIETLARVGYRFIAPVDRADNTSKDAHRRLGMGWKVIVPAAVAVTGLVAGSYLYFRRPPKLTEKDSIVLADFTNTTGDPVFDGALRQGLSVQLEQTPFLRVISGDQITQTLKMMEQPLDARLTPALAREVCQRTNATVEIEGSIAALGNQYVLGLNAVNCSNGETLAREQVTADGKEKVLPALSGAASELRSKLGESGASLKTYDVPLEQATTPSLEALQAYSQGSQAFWRADLPAAISSFQRAVDLDPNFAVAHSWLGTMYGAMGNSDLAAKNNKRAYDLRDRTSEYENLAVSGGYNGNVTRDFDKTEQLFEQMTKTYPRDAAAWNGLGITALQLGRYDQAVAALSEAVRLNPSSFPYGYLSWGYLHQNRFEEARATIEQARSMHIEPYGASRVLYVLDFLQNDQAGMTEQLAHPWTDAALGSSEDTQSATAAYGGHLSNARDLTRRAIASATSAQSRDLVGDYSVESALREALFGNLGEARKEAKEASKLSTDRDVRGWAALALVLSGDPAEAQKLTEDLNQRFPEATYVRFVHLPAIEAARALGQGNPQEAIESLGTAAPYELILPAFGSSFGPMIPVYLRGEAYLAAHKGAEAAAEFEKILEHRGIVWNAPISALAHLGLGRAYALQGDTAKARAAYQDFLTLWKDADPDIPILVQAKAEYARLQNH
jgi:DNA-binding winged helix-turn-helix (wHTH) protein/tetratricopeptide (TPR) repeat protein